MPILDQHVMIALSFAVHTAPCGREQYGLWILFGFPLLGSIVYFCHLSADLAHAIRGTKGRHRSGAQSGSRA